MPTCILFIQSMLVLMQGPGGFRKVDPPTPCCLQLSGLTHLSLTLNPESRILFCFGRYDFPNVHTYQNKSLFLGEVKSSLT